MKIKAITNYSDLISLEDAWNKFLLESNHSIFSTMAWLSTWWKHLGKGRKLLFLIAEENGEIIGAAPLMYSVESMFGLHRGKLEFIGTPNSNYNHFIIRRNKTNQQQIFDYFIEYLSKLPEKWLFLSLREIPASAECIPFLKERSKLTQGTRCSHMPLPESYEVFLKNLSYKRRGSVNNTMNKLKKNFSVNFADYSSPSLCMEGLQLLIDLHQKRWNSVGLSGSFASQKTRDFHFEIARSFAKKNILKLDILELNGKPVSGSYGFKYGLKYYAYLPGFDPDYSKFGVGSILVPFLVEKLVKEGLTEFDFMRGDQEYKKTWNAIQTWNYNAILTKKGSFSNVTYTIFDDFWKIGSLAKAAFLKTKINR